MSLKKYLRKQGYDLIEGPVRDHKTLQLWLKRAFNEVELYYSDIDQAFKSDVKLHEIKNDALTVNATQKDDYGFNIGITVLEQILKSLGMSNMDLSSKIKSGKKVIISYDNSMTKECPSGQIGDYLSGADFRHHNPALLRNANRNHILVLSGVVFAKNLIIDIETDFDLTSKLIDSLNSASDGKLDFTMSGKSSLKMVSSKTGYFPIAVKADRIDFDKGKFNKLTIVTDDRNFF